MGNRLLLTPDVMLSPMVLPSVAKCVTEGGAVQPFSWGSCRAALFPTLCQAAVPRGTEWPCSAIS